MSGATDSCKRAAIPCAPILGIAAVAAVLLLCRQSVTPATRPTRQDLPERHPCADPLELSVDPVTIVVARDAEGSVTMRLEGEGVDRTVAGAPELASVLRQLRRESRNSSALLSSNHPIAVAPAPGTTWGDATDAFNAAAAAGYTRVGFSGGDQ